MRIVSHTTGGRPDGHGAPEPDAPRGADPRGDIRRSDGPVPVDGCRRGLPLGPVAARGSLARRPSVGQGSMSYLFDTTVAIDWSLAKPGVKSVVDACFAETGLLYTCDVVTSEALSGGSDEEREIIHRFLQALEYVALDPDGAAEAGELRRQAGRTSSRSLGDVLIAALARRLEATIVTRNEADFSGLGARVLGYGPVAGEILR